MHELWSASSTSTLITSATDIMPSIPASLSDATASTQVTAAVHVSVQYSASPIASLSIELLLSSRPLIILGSLPRIPLWR